MVLNREIFLADLVVREWCGWDCMYQDMCTMAHGLLCSDLGVHEYITLAHTLCGECSISSVSYAVLIGL